VALVGQSMGAALAAVLAAEAARAGERVPALVLLAPYLAAPASVRLGRAAGAAARPRPSSTCRATAARARSTTPRRARQALGYGVVTPHLVRELARVVDLARRALPHVDAPTLAVLSRLDHRVAPADGAAAFARVGAGSRRGGRRSRRWCGSARRGT
jgi:pimeloyl-ACP methyl ester carboxylesterase